MCGGQFEASEVLPERQAYCPECVACCLDGGHHPTNHADDSHPWSWQTKTELIQHSRLGTGERPKRRPKPLTGTVVTTSERGPLIIEP